MNQNRFRVLGWLIPAFAVMVSIGVMIRQFAVLRDSEARHLQAIARLGSAMDTRSRADRLAREWNYSAVTNSPDEQNSFLLGLRQKATADDVTITNWISSSGVYGEGGGPVSPDGKPESLDLLRGFTRIDCALTMTGSYSGLRKLVGDIGESRRLFNFSKVAWSRTDSGTALSVVISRYLEPSERRNRVALAWPPPSSDKFAGASR